MSRKTCWIAGIILVLLGCTRVAWAHAPQLGEAIAITIAVVMLGTAFARVLIVTVITPKQLRPAWGRYIALSGVDFVGLMIASFIGILISPYGMPMILITIGILFIFLEFMPHLWLIGKSENNYFKATLLGLLPTACLLIAMGVTNLVL